MKIAYVHTGLWPSNSPSTTFVTYNAIGLCSKFAEVHLFVKASSTVTPEKVLKETFGIQHPNNLFIHAVAMPGFLKSNHFYFYRIYNTLKKLFLANQLQVVVSRNVTFLPYLSRLRQKFEIKTFFESHDFFSDLALRDDVNSAKKWKYQKLENSFIPKITGVFCLQNSQKRLYENHYPNQNFYLLRTGINEIKKRDIEKKEFLTYIGSFDSNKGLNILYKALKLIDEKLHVLLIGGKNKVEINKMIELFGSLQQHEIIVTGWIDKKKMKEYLGKTALGFVPLTDTFFNRYVTSPLKLFDYFSFCIPVIASDLPTTRELLVPGRSGLLFDPEDHIQLSEEIQKLIHDEELRRKMSKFIFENSKKYLWSKRAEIKYQILEEAN